MKDRIYSIQLSPRPKNIRVRFINAIFGAQGSFGLDENYYLNQKQETPQAHILKATFDVSYLNTGGKFVEHKVNASSIYIPDFQREGFLGIMFSVCILPKGPRINHHPNQFFEATGPSILLPTNAKLLGSKKLIEGREIAAATQYALLALMLNSLDSKDGILKEPDVYLNEEIDLSKPINVNVSRDGKFYVPIFINQDNN